MAGKRPFRRVNPLALAVLTLLSERPMHPYQLSQTLKQRGKEGSVRINFGALYAVVESLLQQGFIEVVGAEQDGNRPARTIYRVTDAGYAETRDWMRAWLSEPEKEYPRFMAALSFLPMLGPGEVTELLRRRVALLDGQIGAARAQAAEVEDWLPELLMVEGNYEVRMLEAEREFTAELADRIESGVFGGLDGWYAMRELVDKYPGGRVPPEETDRFMEERGMPKPPS